MRRLAGAVRAQAWFELAHSGFLVLVLIASSSSMSLVAGKGRGEGMVSKEGHQNFWWPNERT